MPAVTILILILGGALSFLAFFILRSKMKPNKAASIESLIRQKRASTAIKLASQMVAKNPRNCDLRYLLGKAYLADKKQELAIREFQEINKGGNFSSRFPEKEFRKSIAPLFVRFGQIEEALKEYLLLIKLEPGEAEHYYQAGLLFEARSNTEKASQYYSKTVELDDHHSEAHFKKGASLYQQKLPGEARKELEKALLVDQHNVKAYYVIGKILKDNQDYLAAIHAFEKSLRDPAYKVKSLIERGECYIYTGNIDMALIELNRALALSKQSSSPEVLHTRYWVAHCYERKASTLNKAYEQWGKIHAANPSYRDVEEKLSHYRDARIDDAIKDYLTCTKGTFRQLAEGIARDMGLTVQRGSDMPNGFQLVGIETAKGWLGIQHIQKLIWFLRTSDVISEEIVRSFHDDMKKQGISRGFIFASSTFSDKAKIFAETRPIDLMNKQDIQTALKKIKNPTMPF